MHNDNTLLYIIVELLSNIQLFYASMDCTLTGPSVNGIS